MSDRPRVDVRRGRDGLELRVDGALASLQRPGRVLTGTVWWALAAPVVLVPRRHPRVLVLGLGGGSVARALRALVPAAEIVGVENDAEVLRAARRHFDLDGLGVELLAMDARDYLRSEVRRFDLIVEDLFVGPVRTVRKPDWLLAEGYPRIRRRLRPGGIVSVNSIHESPAIVGALAGFPGRVVSLDVHGHWNRILLCGRNLPPPRALRGRLARNPALSRVLSRVSLRSSRWPRAARGTKRPGLPPSRSTFGAAYLIE